MNSIAMLEPLLAPIAAIQRLIEKLGNQGIIIGGVAASLLGQPRLPDVVDFARRSRVVLLTHTQSGIHVDISLGLLPFEVEAVERSQEYQAGSLAVRLPTPEDLIILKAVAHRPKDMPDIEAVLKAQPM